VTKEEVTSAKAVADELLKIRNTAIALGFKTQDAIRNEVAKIIGRTIESSYDMTTEERRKVLTSLVGRTA
jgi:hypothetical protein